MTSGNAVGGKGLTLGQFTLQWQFCSSNEDENRSHLVSVVGDLLTFSSGGNRNQGMQL